MTTEKWIFSAEEKKRMWERGILRLGSNYVNEFFCHGDCGQVLQRMCVIHRGSIHLLEKEEEEEEEWVREDDEHFFERWK